MEKAEEIDLGLIQKYLQELPEKALQLGVRVLLAVVFFLIGLQLIKIIRKLLGKALKKGNADKGVIQFLDSFVKVGLLILLLFSIASSFGLDAASVVALLGSAGVAIGLALQGSLSNFAGGVLILLLKPFKVGDYIIEDNKKNEGTVTEIQLFYTKLVTMDDKVIILPNGTLANTSLTNVTATYKRRLDIYVGISYQADTRLAKQVLGSVIDEEKSVLREEEPLVYVHELAESAVIMGIRVWVANEDYFHAKCGMMEQIKRKLEENGIAIPYSQMDIHITNT